mmetsp:Transcript_16832/g.18760  ORF Transcript_16832/g.18760 Transcript_16832/m.18760 type:complete len:292 (-) Transcript_16832:105-980(-)|eukprot:CAMPEP_0205830564 /NCGR_PEP_ID=MMETSP0206-20130828/41431_1 /ASSEMBLY_ACC=CAM_ASM_000279 /TAXON_ID=36767 /ORGANISM="Euplotes focardii, Strain TN1" /LENGTH=291 /DNA_ID=CAMNT_0053134353 /DNA_START=29 /DNA_END=904 /DNA_ORIENTATION=-
MWCYEADSWMCNVQFTLVATVSIASLVLAGLQLWAESHNTSDLQKMLHRTSLWTALGLWGFAFHLFSQGSDNLAMASEILRSVNVGVLTIVFGLATLFYTSLIKTALGRDSTPITDSMKRVTVAGSMFVLVLVGFCVLRIKIDRQWPVSVNNTIQGAALSGIALRYIIAMRHVRQCVKNAIRLQCAEASSQLFVILRYVHASLGLAFALPMALGSYFLVSSLLLWTNADYFKEAVPRRGTRLNLFLGCVGQAGSQIAGVWLSWTPLQRRERIGTSGFGTCTELSEPLMVHL